jgi:dTDP-4-amino-4,6-dideoxygalactose transaminase
MWAYKDHGKRATESGGSLNWSTAFKWVRESAGTNYRMTEMQSAIGRIMLRRLPEWVERRRTNAHMLNEAFADTPGIRLTIPPEHVYHSYYKYYFFIEPDSLRDDWFRDRIIVEIMVQGVPCFAGSCPEIYLEKAFDGARPMERLPVAKELGEISIMLLVHPTLGEGEMERTIDAVRRVMKRAVR